MTDYVGRVMADIEALDFDPGWKREIRLTARLIEAGSELCKIKLHPERSRGEAAALAEKLEELIPEFREIWMTRNYEKGEERFEEYLTSRRDELRALAATGHV